MASPLFPKHPLGPPASAPGRRCGGRVRLWGWRRRDRFNLGHGILACGRSHRRCWRQCCSRFNLHHGSVDQGSLVRGGSSRRGRRLLRCCGAAPRHERRRLAHGRTPAWRFGFPCHYRFTRHRGLRSWLFVARAVGTVREDVVYILWLFVPRVFDRRSAKIRDRVCDFLVDRRHAVLRRTCPDVTVLAPTTSTAAAAAAAPPPTVAIAVIGPTGA